jgi:hypothetical protein
MGARDRLFGGPSALETVDGMPHKGVAITAKELKMGSAIAVGFMAFAAIWDAA